MAMIKCSECEQELSDRAELCIRCGNPMKTTNSKLNDVNGNEETLVNKVKPILRNKKVIAAITVALIVLLLLGFFVFRSDNSDIIASMDTLMEITFRGGEADLVNIIMVARSERDARELEEEIYDDLERESIEASIVREGRSVITILSFQDYIELDRWEIGNTREEVIEAFEGERAIVIQRGNRDNSPILISWDGMMNISFRKGTVDEITYVERFWSENSAIDEYEFLSDELSSDAVISREGQTITITVNNNSDFNIFFEDILGYSEIRIREDSTREDILRMFERASFSVLR